MLVKNWKQMWKSYAVLLPALVSAILLVLDETIAHGVFPETWLPVAIFISGFVGRIIKQDNLHSPNKLKNTKFGGRN